MREDMSLERDVMWLFWSEEGLEHLKLVWDGASILADGVVVGVEEGVPFRTRYELRCDARWRTREVVASALVRDGREIRLLADGEGRWIMANGEPVPALDGCIDVDISATPFTNTLPIRRLGLELGEATNLKVAYLAVPEMRVEPAQQRYTCLERDDQGGLYRYESLDGEFAGFTADLPVDADGLVLDYPGLFRRARLG